MNAIATFRKCTLSDEELIKKIDAAVDGMYDPKTGGSLPTRHIPARPNEDFDLLVGELLIRFSERIEKEKPQVSNSRDWPNEVSFWIMRDNHTFIKLKGTTLKALMNNASEMAKEAPHGMLCAPTLIYTDKEQKIGEHHHIDKDGNVDVQSWLSSFTDHPFIKQKFMLG